MKERPPEQAKSTQEGSQRASFHPPEGNYAGYFARASEGLNQYVKEMRQRSYSQNSDSAMLMEIRDLLRKQAIAKKLEDMAAFSAKFNEDFNRKREETLAASQGRGEKISIGSVLLGLLLGILSAPAAWVEETIEEAKQQADQAA